MSIVVRKESTGIHRAYFVDYTASNGVTYKLVVNKFMGYTLGEDRESFFEADLSNEEREDFWKNSMDAINKAIPEEAEISKKGFDSEKVYAKK